MLSPSLERYLLEIYKKSMTQEEIKIGELSKTLNAPLKKTIQALQRLHFQKFLVYSAYQPIMITEKGIAMAKYLQSKDLILEEFLEILLFPKECNEERETMQQYFSEEAIECFERFVIFIKQYPEITNRYKVFSKRKLKTRLLEPKPEEQV